MSYTEIYKFKKDGDAECVAEIRNAHRGAMKIWLTIEERYLPPNVNPLLPNMPFSRMFDFGTDKNKEIWDLFYSPKLNVVDRIVLGSTFDNVIVERADIYKLLMAFRLFNGETSLKEQASEIEVILKNDPDLIAIAWNQTSVNCDVWISLTNEYDSDGNRRPYNLFKHKSHWSLFEHIRKQKY